MEYVNIVTGERYIPADGETIPGYLTETDGWRIDAATLRGNGYPAWYVDTPADDFGTCGVCGCDAEDWEVEAD